MYKALSSKCRQQQEEIVLQIQAQVTWRQQYYKDYVMCDNFEEATRSSVGCCWKSPQGVFERHRMTTEHSHTKTSKNYGITRYYITSGESVQHAVTEIFLTRSCPHCLTGHAWGYDPDLLSLSSRVLKMRTGMEPWSVWKILWDAFYSHYIGDCEM